MRKWTCFLVLTAALLLFGCGQDQHFERRVSFIYPKQQLSYGSQDALFSSEYREGASLSRQELIELYLAGPVSEDFVDPFPENVTVVYAEDANQTFTLVLSDTYASMTGLDLSIANACLAMTAMDLSGCDTLVISCETEVLDGEQSITVTKDSLIYYDDSTGVIPSDQASENSVSQ